MPALDILSDGFDRVREGVREVAGSLSVEQLETRPAEDANSIAWLLWHASRVQDAQMADLAGTPEVWITGGWAERFGLSLDPSDTGYGHTPEQVASVRGLTAEQLVGYQEATAARTKEILAGLDEPDLVRVIDVSYDPPVTVGVRVLSILADDLEHVGQAAFVRGMIEHG
ncbi:DinB family protein [Sanguibacter sp. 25GB23B1]|uniref:mycothiol transferase n=1 Tax=unclassified Sanguibacter TaxID=2645534 RepID=UPI0032AFD438